MGAHRNAGFQNPASPAGGTGFSRRLHHRPKLPVAPADADVLIRNGRVLDGSGRSAFPADVAVRNGRIVANGELVHLRATRTHLKPTYPGAASVSIRRSRP